MKVDPLVTARKALSAIWDASWLCGRCWGRRKGNSNNPYAASNITIGVDEEIVSICLLRDGKLRIHEFRRVEATSLGNLVRQELAKAGLSVEE